MEGDLRFVHLRVSSEYSLLQGAVRLKELPALCRRNGMPAVAVTDHNNMFGALEFATGAVAEGIQPIHGCAVSMIAADEPGARPGIPTLAPLVLLAKNAAGYSNLLKLNSLLYLSDGRDIPMLHREELKDRSDGLICLTGGSEGPVGRLIGAGRNELAEGLLNELADVFPDRLYVELQRHRVEGSELSNGEGRTESGLVELAYKLGLPLVATNDVHFPERNLFEAHDAMMCIAEGAYVDQKSGRRQLTPEHHFKSQDEMSELFEDLPEALESTIEIARRCSFCSTGRKPILPVFTKNEAEEMRRQARDGLEVRLEAITLSAPAEDYHKRLEYELDVIESMGFAGYFLIVADFIKWAKNNDIPVGAGRGSGAGSLVAFALTITDVDPLRFSLLFERFLNPERISMPDFDIDFCQERRDEVIRYVQDKYGSERVAHIITFGALLARAAIRDVGRVLRVPYSRVDRIAKLIPRDGAKMVSISEALASEPKLVEERDSDPTIERLFRNAGAIEGLLRNASTHAAGVVIGDRPLDELVPLYKDSRSEIPATQFSMKWVEKAGLVKFDFLGLKTLTVIKRAVDLLHADGIGVDIDNLPFDDERTFKLCASGETVAVFQLESTGMKDALRMMNPNSIEDIVALIALYRPGPMENIPDYCAVKNGKKKRKRQHKLIDQIVAETHGIIVYQEQVMQIAQAMAGYSLAEADLLRRAIGKKIKSEMDAEKPKFLKGANQKEVKEKTANEVWELMAKFAEYGFNKAHAAAYAVVVYQTAWLKANHPIHFMTSVMNCDIGDTDKLQSFVRELKRLNIKLKPPCVNNSQAEFSIVKGEIAYGLGALKNVGVEAMRNVVSARGDRKFDGLFDFAERVDLKMLGKRQLETLALSGAFDCLERNRRRVLENVGILINYSSTVRTEKESGQMSLFGDATISLPEPHLPEPNKWSHEKQIEEEFKAIGFYLSGHPLDEYMDRLREEGVVEITKLPELVTGRTKSYIIAGVVTAVRRRKSQRGSQYAFVEISDSTATAEITVFSEELAMAGDGLKAGAKIKVVVEAKAEKEKLSLRVAVIDFIQNDVRPTCSGLRIFFNSTAAPATLLNFLQSILKGEDRTQRGSILCCPVAKSLPVDTEIKIPGLYPVNEQIKNAITSLEGIVKVETY